MAGILQTVGEHHDDLVDGRTIGRSVVSSVEERADGVVERCPATGRNASGRSSGASMTSTSSTRTLEGVWPVELHEREPAAGDRRGARSRNWLKPSTTSAAIVCIEPDRSSRTRDVELVSTPVTGPGRWFRW